MLISCFGGAEYFQMTDKLEKEFKNGISQAAVTKGTFGYTIRKIRFNLRWIFRCVVTDDWLEQGCVETDKTVCSSLQITEQSIV